VLIANLYTQIVMGSLMFFTSLFLIFLILIQRGRGGGLAGALGGSGGSSAFGAKAGDTFTRVTAGLAVFWFVLCLLTILFIQGPRARRTPDDSSSVSSSGETQGELPGTPAVIPGADGTGTGVPSVDQLIPPVDIPTTDLPPAVETPAVEAPAVETPAVEIPAVEIPAVETPADAGTPATDAPPTGTPPTGGGL